MIADERIREYIDSLEEGNSDMIEAIRSEAIADEVPIIRRDTEELLKSYLISTGARYVLEVGTGVAYASIVMSSVMGEDAHITTIEKYPPRIEKARVNIAKLGLENRIDMIEEDASEALKELADEKPGHFDLIFMDAAKAQYLNWLEPSIRLLRDRGVLFSDNVLLDGSIIESRYSIERRDRTIHARMREYLYTIKHDSRLATSIVTVGDGVAVSIKKESR